MGGDELRDSYVAWCEASSGVQAAYERRVVGSFASYREAERAVDRLADSKFPVERTAIVGRDLRFVEQITGRVGYLDAALRAAFAGAVVGFLIDWLFAVQLV